jgi:hypothetical protein
MPYPNYIEEVEISIFHQGSAGLTDSKKEEYRKIKEQSEAFAKNTKLPAIIYYVKLKKIFCLVQMKQAYDVIMQHAKSGQLTNEMERFEYAQILREFRWQFYYLLNFHASIMEKHFTDKKGNNSKIASKSDQIKAKISLIMDIVAAYKLRLIELQGGEFK